MTPVLSVMLARTPDVSGWTLPVTVRPSMWLNRRDEPSTARDVVLLVKTTFWRRDTVMSLLRPQALPLYPWGLPATVLPLIVSYVYHKGDWKKRKKYEWTKMLDK